MSKSSGRGGSGRGSGTVTVIEQRIHHSAAQNARVAFIITSIVFGLTTLVSAADRMHPVLALFVAIPVAAISGALVWTLVRIWPVLRLIWWWTPEISITVLTVWGWTLLAASTPTLLTFAILGVLVGGIVAVPLLRRWTIALYWCVVVRHRLRVCFSQFIFANRSGSLPLILMAWPTPVGERVWVMLRPGLSLKHLGERLDKIAVACFATTVTVDQAGRSNSALVRFDIKRREVLTAQVNSPLVDFLDPTAPMADKQPATVVSGLDLPDIDDDTQPIATPAKSRTTAGSNGKKAAATPPADQAEDDVTQWI